jgi:isochorismate synthase
MTHTSVLDNRILDTIGVESLLKASLYSALENAYAIACWSQPESTQWDILIDPVATILPALETPSLHHLESGYLIAPFQAIEKKYLIKNRVHIIVNDSIEYHVTDGYEWILEEIKEIDQTKTQSIHSLLKESTESNIHTDHFYKASVDQAKILIANGTFQKVVLARSKTIQTSIVDIHKTLLELRVAYPHSFITAFYHPEIGLWVIASPELLLSTDTTGTFKTVALAGTQAYNPNIPARDVSWTHKEIEEQALVSRYIIGCFKSIRLRDYVEQGPRTIQAGNLLHLKTEYTANTNEVNMKEIGATMLQLLHPTSAVCGMPKKTALEFIEATEPFNRKFYSGYSGPVNINKETSLFVTLRCAEIHAKGITLYAGAGITADSDPDKEFEETNLKMDVIGKVFRNLTI